MRKFGYVDEIREIQRGPWPSFVAPNKSMPMRIAYDVIECPLKIIRADSDDIETVLPAAEDASVLYW